ncbi:MAG TPA: hypothetical protein VH814_12595 [Steroidobacteraceae bacterium]|jgi:hypothetical protein
MRGSPLYAAIFCGVLCYGAPTVSSAVKPDLSEKQLQQAGLDEGAIEPERLSVLIRRALDAAATLRDARTPKEETLGTSNALRIDAAIKAAAAELLVFRNYLIEHALPGAERPIQWPRWMFEPPTDKTPVQVLRARIDWLNRNATPMTDAVCDLASVQTGDHLVCSVE